MTVEKTWAREHVKGLWTSPLTPFLEDGGVDHDGIRHNVDFLVELGVDGIGFGFSEPWAMSIAERHESIETFVDAAKGRVKCYVHPTDHSTVETVRLAQHAAQLGADAVMIWAPFEWAKSQRMIGDFYEHVCGQIPLPVFAYNTPHSGRLMTRETLERIADIPNLCALKNAVNSLATSADLHRAVGDRLVVSDPLEENFPLAITQLDQQVLLGTTSVYFMQSALRQPIVEYAEAFRRGDLDEGWRIYHQLDPLRLFWQKTYDVLWGDSALHPLSKLKVWMDAIGMRGGGTRPPAAPIDDAGRKAFIEELRNTPLVSDLYPGM